MVTALLAGLALAGPDFSLETRYASAYGPDSWGTVHLRAEAAENLDVGVLAVGGTRSALLASVRQGLDLGDRLHWRGELLFGMRRTAVDREGGPAVGIAGDGALDATSEVAVVAGGGWVPGIGGWFEGGIDAAAGQRFVLHPRLRAGTWAGDRDPALRVSLGATHRWRSGWFLRGAVGAGGRDTLHLGPSFTFALGRSL